MKLKRGFLFVPIFAIFLNFVSCSNSSKDTGEHILILGDSNGASEHGWVNQLKQLCPADSFYNTSLSGNTIGFDNLGKPELNTLKNIDRYLNAAETHLGTIDNIIIMLGTNDCKAVFHDSLSMVPQNLKKLIENIKGHPVVMANQPTIYIVSPPPFGPDEIMLEKYHGGAARVAWLHPQFKKIAMENGCLFVDVYTPLLPKWADYAEEGIHPNAEGQMAIAKIIHRALVQN